MHESLGLVLVDVAPKQLSTLRFKIREGCPTVPYSSLVEPLGKLFKPEHVDFTFLGVGIYVISHQLVTGTFQGLQSLALHAGVIPDDQNSVAINPGRREVLWEDFPANKSAPFPATLSVHTSRLGDPAHALWNLPSAVQNLCLHLKNANVSHIRNWSASHLITYSRAALHFVDVCALLAPSRTVAQNSETHQA